MSVWLVILFALGFVGVPVGVGVAAYHAGKNSALPPGRQNPHLLPAGGEAIGRLVSVSPYKAEADSIREARRQLRLLDISGLPELREKRDRTLSQLESFCTASDNVEHELSNLFAQTSITYDVHMDAFYLACERFLENELVAAAMLKRFDSQRYKRLKAQAEAETKASDVSTPEVAANMQAGTDIVPVGELETDIVRIESLMTNGDYAGAEDALAQVKNKYSMPNANAATEDALAVMSSELDEIDEILVSNEMMLSNIDKFAAKLRELASARRESDSMVAEKELERITENLKHYQ